MKRAVAPGLDHLRRPNHIDITEGNANMAETILRVQCKDLNIGNIEFDALRNPESGEFLMGQGQILDPIEVNKSWFSKLPKDGFLSLEAKQRYGLDRLPAPIKVKYIRDGITRTALARPLESVRIVWRYFDRTGNPKAQVLIDALTEDSLKDRFEQVYGARRSEEQRRKDDSRILEFACPGDPVFDADFEREIARITGYHKNDIRNGRIYWEFVYFWLTPEERSDLEKINPVLESGRRKYKIHDCLKPETKERLKPFQLKQQEPRTLP